MGWISWAHIAPYLVSFGPFGLTVVGAWMALTPPRQGGWGRFVLLALVLVVGLPTSWATLQANLSADRTSADTNQRVKGLSDALSTFAQQTETLTPHTFAVEAGTSFHVPSVMAEVVVHPKPDIKTNVYLPKPPFKGEEVTVKIGPGNIGTGGFVDVYGNGFSIDGQPVFSLAFAGQSCTFKFDGTDWGCT